MPKEAAYVGRPTRYDEPGTLSRPDPIGRVIRFIFGAVCVYVVLAILTQPSAFSRDVLSMCSPYGSRSSSDSTTSRT